MDDLFWAICSGLVLGSLLTAGLLLGFVAMRLLLW